MGKLAEKLFAGPCEFVRGATGLDQLPPATLPEVAFVGRSNVGKSSLLNALTGRSTLARASNTPGRTRQINFFNLGDTIMLVDLPGYGYAKAAKSDIEQWQETMRGYLRGRVSLRLVCLLIDARHGFKENDGEMMEMLDNSAVPFQTVLTKCDKVKASELAQREDEILLRLQTQPAALMQLATTSAETGEGLDSLRALLLERTRK